MKHEVGNEDSRYKVVEDYRALAEVARGLQAINRRVVVTIGSWDLLHIGHVRYLRKAREYGDVLLVGVDTDRTVRLYKGELRPVVPFEERCEMLTYQSCVDFVTGVDDIDEKGRWQYGLIQAVRPDIFVAVEDSYPKEQLEQIAQYAKKLVVLPRQAENTSTTNMIQVAVKKHLDKVYELVDHRIKQA